MSSASLPSRSEILLLYRRLLKLGRSFKDYNLREFTKRKVETRVRKFFNSTSTSRRAGNSKRTFLIKFLIIIFYFIFQFHSNSTLSDPAAIRAAYSFGEENLSLLSRQSTVSNLYWRRDHIIEARKKFKIPDVEEIPRGTFNLKK